MSPEQSTEGFADPAQGLAALLVLGLSGCPPETVVQMDPDWISHMGLQQSLTPSRNNGFLNMFKLMQQKSLQLCVAKVRRHVMLQLK